MACVQQEFYIAATGLLFNSQEESCFKSGPEKLV